MSKRQHKVRFTLTGDERQMLVAAAAKTGLCFTTWCRWVLMREATGGEREEEPKQPKGARGNCGWVTGEP